MLMFSNCLTWGYQSKDQTNDVAAYLKKYSLKKLKNDLNMFIDERRATFKTVFLDQVEYPTAPYIVLMCCKSRGLTVNC